MSVHDLCSMTWPAFQALDASTVVAILPLGAIEAHGPHLPLGTDIVIAEAMARAGAERLSARGLSVSCCRRFRSRRRHLPRRSQGRLTRRRTRPPIDPRASRAAWRRAACASMAIANAHHDPGARRSDSRGRRRRRTEIAATIVFPDLTRRRWAERLTDEFQSGACHAGRYEGSIVLAAAPDLVDMRGCGAARQSPLARRRHQARRHHLRGGRRTGRLFWLAGRRDGRRGA